MKTYQKGSIDVQFVISRKNTMTGKWHSIVYKSDYALLLLKFVVFFFIFIFGVDFILGGIKFL